MFPIAVRRIAAAEWRDEFEAKFPYGTYDDMLPKKYQAASTPAARRQSAQAKRLRKVR